MTNKELAVQLYAASLQATATVMSNPNYKDAVASPTADEMVASVAEIAEKLSRIKDN